MPNRNLTDGGITIADLMFLLLLTILVVFLSAEGESNHSLEGNLNPVRTIRVVCDPAAQLNASWRDEKLWTHPDGDDSGKHTEGILWEKKNNSDTNEIMISTFFTGLVTKPGFFKMASDTKFQVEWKPSDEPQVNYEGTSATLEIQEQNIRISRSEDDA